MNPIIVIFDILLIVIPAFAGMTAYLEGVRLEDVGDLNLSAIGFLRLVDI